jgi:hypothetical protein
MLLGKNVRALRDQSRGGQIEDCAVGEESSAGIEGPFRDEPEIEMLAHLADACSTMRECEMALCQKLPL